MGAGHDHTHGAGERGLRWALALTSTVLVAEAAGAYFTNSLALLSDAAHMLTDAASLFIALVAIRLGRRSADRLRTFGYYRFEILAAVVNAVMLLLAGAYILLEAYRRLRAPGEIEPVGMLAVATVGLIANLVSMKMLHGQSESSLNLKGAYLEVWSDALGSAGVVVSAIVIYFTGWRQVDPIVAVAIGLWILPRSWSLLSESINILLEGVPQGLAVDAIHRKLMAISGVAGVHDLHVWSITTGKNTLTAHLTLDASAGDPQSVLREARAAIEEFGITHSTVQIETARCEPGPDCNLGAHPPHSH